MFLQKIKNNSDTNAQNTKVGNMQQIQACSSDC